MALSPLRRTDAHHPHRSAATTRQRWSIHACAPACRRRGRGDVVTVDRSTTRFSAAAGRGARSARIRVEQRAVTPRPHGRCFLWPTRDSPHDRARPTTGSDRGSLRSRDLTLFVGRLRHRIHIAICQSWSLLFIFLTTTADPAMSSNIVLGSGTLPSIAPPIIAVRVAGLFV